MMDWSDRHCRYLWRLLSEHARLYTEMVVSGAIVHGDRTRFLRFNAEEHPLALQVGGSDPSELAQCAAIAEEWRYDEINLNCGCPSDRVQKGKIGAVLMREPNLVADCISAMRSASTLPVTVKHRIGVDDMEGYDALSHFVATVSDAGCKVFIVHARKAWLKGLSPKENREVPPLDYEQVLRLKRDFPELCIVMNGGITSLETCKSLLHELDGVMVGREAYSRPFFLSDVDRELFDQHTFVKDRLTVARNYAEYCQTQLDQGARLHHMTRHILGLFAGCAGGKQFRRHLSQHAHRPRAGANILHEALQALEDRVATEHMSH